MAFPPDPIAADKVPGPPATPEEHPDHHNELADAINDVVEELTTGPIGVAVGNIATVATTADAALPKVAGGASVENIGAVEENVEVANVTGSKAMDLATYGRFVYTMTGDTTFSMLNPAPSGKASTFVLRVKGAFVPTVPASWDFIGTPPAYVGTGEGTSYVGTTEDGGTSYQVTVLAGWA